MTLIDIYFDKYQEYINLYGNNCFLLFQVGAFFEVYGTEDKKTKTYTKGNILEFTQVCDLNMSVKTEKDDHFIKMAGFRDYSIEKYLRKIKSRGYTSVVYVQEEKKGVKDGEFTRVFDSVCSPGTYFHEDDNDLTNSCMSLWIEKVKLRTETKIIIGCATVDIVTGTTSIFEYSHNYGVKTIEMYDILDQYIQCNNPSEIIFITNLSCEEELFAKQCINIENKTIHSICLHDETNIRYAEAINCEKQSYQKEILEKYYVVRDYNAFSHCFGDFEFAKQSFCFLLNFLHGHNPGLVHKLKEPVMNNQSHHMLLANNTLRQLNITPDHNYKGIYSSLIDFLNRCISPIGKRCMKQMLIQPHTNGELLNASYSDTMKISNENVKFIRDELYYIKDIEKYARKIYLKKLTPKEIYQLHKSLLHVLNIMKYCGDELKTYETILYADRIQESIESFITRVETELNIEKCKDIDTVKFEDNIFKCGLYDELDVQLNNYNESEERLQQIHKLFEETIHITEKKKLKTDYVKINISEKGNYSFLITSRRFKILKENLLTRKSGLVECWEPDWTNIEGIKATTSQLSIHNDFIDTTFRQLMKSKSLFVNVIQESYNSYNDVLVNYCELIQDVSRFIETVDQLQCKKYIAHKYNYSMPTIEKGEKSLLRIEELRHPLLEHLQKDELYVTNNITLGDGNTQGMLLYGTNAVGKTSFIRAIGLCIYMAQCGFFVPCKHLSYVPYEHIFSRILNQDNMFKGLSTFAVEMCELGNILKHASNKSLILGDELCSGTEMDSAISIFVSGIQELHKRDCSFIFATHLHEIVDYDEISSLTNLSLNHMEVYFDREKDELIYDRKLKFGPGESMYGLEVCKSLHLPSSFIDAAYTIREKYGSRRNMLQQKQSRYNSDKIMSLCELCNVSEATEIHHLQFQKYANDADYIEQIHKNHKGNLISICDACHDKIHSENLQLKKVKTSNGHMFTNI